MIKKITICPLLSFLFILSSCSKDDEHKKSDEALLTGSWKITATNSYYFYEDELEIVEEESFDTAPYNILTLEADGTAYYETQDYEEKFVGKWSLNDKTFWTNVGVEPGVESAGPLYFFLQGEIMELTVSRFSYKTPMMQTYSEGKTYSYYIETYFEK